jgi:hypothetical protein
MREMNYENARKLEMLLRHLVGQKRGTEVARSEKYKGVTIDAAAFENDANAIKGLWLAIELLESQKSK